MLIKGDFIYNKTDLFLCSVSCCNNSSIKKKLPISTLNGN